MISRFGHQAIGRIGTDQLFDLGGEFSGCCDDIGVTVAGVCGFDHLAVNGYVFSGGCVPNAAHRDDRRVRPFRKHRNAAGRARRDTKK